MKLDKRTAEFRALRRQIEESILPLATSVDGRRFEIQSSLHGLALEAGGYVVLESEDEARLGQVVTLELASVEGSEMTADEGALSLRARMTIRLARGHGVVLGGDGRPFHHAIARPADDADVAGWLDAARPEHATLEIRLAPIFS